jgi:hypothetical protein
MELDDVLMEVDDLDAAALLSVGLDQGVLEPPRWA